MKNKLGLFLLSALAAVILMVTPAYAAAPTDRIDNYAITVNVNEDASVEIIYHIDWTVLESDSVGPLTWVKIGIPNKHHYNLVELSDNISYLSSDDRYVEVHFKDSYYEGQTVSFDFSITQDYLYQVDKLHEGYTVYSFTPGWFDDIAVDNLLILWNADQVDSFTPECFPEGDYYVWNSSLAPGEKYTVTVTYPNDAYRFDLSHDTGKEEKASFFEVVGEIIGVFITIGFLGLFMIGPFVIPFLLSRGFNPKTIKKVERKKIVYFDSCPGCGAVRAPGASECAYCGKSMIQSEEIIKEEDLKNMDKDILKMRTDGLYSYKSSPNTFISVHTTSIPNPKFRSYTSSSGRSGGGHSCAHSSCACACACACAGGGRAGCTNKDFYNTNLRLRYLELKKKFKG